METLLAVVVVTLFPLAVVLTPLLLASRVERRRAAVIARQVELTEAIHRDLGAVVAPFVTRRPGGQWRVRIAVPFERPAVVEAVLAVGHRTVPERFDLVLTPQEGAAPPGARASRQGADGGAGSGGGTSMRSRTSGEKASPGFT